MRTLPRRSAEEYGFLSPLRRGDADGRSLCAVPGAAATVVSRRRAAPLRVSGQRSASCPQVSPPSRSRAGFCAAHGRGVSSRGARLRCDRGCTAAREPACEPRFQSGTGTGPAHCAGSWSADPPRRVEGAPHSPAVGPRRQCATAKSRGRFSDRASVRFRARAHRRRRHDDRCDRAGTGHLPPALGDCARECAGRRPTVGRRCVRRCRPA